MGHPARILIYGAYGTTGRQAARWLAEHHPTRRSDFVLAGRRAEPLRTVAERRGFAHRAFALDDPKQVAAHLSDIDTVLLLAGPFVQTSPIMIEACMLSHTDYLDIGGEKEVHVNLFERCVDRIREADIVVIPGASFETAVFDGLATMLAHEHGTPNLLELGYRPGTIKPSRAAMLTAFEMAASGEVMLARVDGKLERPLKSRTRRRMRFPEHDEVELAFFGLTEVYTSWFSTQIPNIFTYLPRGPARMMRWMGRIFRAAPFLRSIFEGLVARSFRDSIATLPVGGRAHVAGVVSGNGRRVSAMLTVNEVGSFFAASAVLCALRLRDVRRDLAPGTYTPSMAFGRAFFLGLPGVEFHGFR